MRYLTLSKSGNWYFRYQLPRQQRPLFENRSEIKRSLKTSCKHEAKLLALELELSIRKKVMGQFSRNELWSVSKPPAIEKKATKPDTCPFSILEKFYLYKLDHDSPKTTDCSGEIETAHSGYLGSQGTFYVGNLKGVVLDAFISRCSLMLTAKLLSLSSIRPKH